MILQKVTMLFITLASLWTNSSFLPVQKPGPYNPCLTCTQRRLQPAPAVLLLQVLGNSCFTADSRTPPRAVPKHPCWVPEDDTAIAHLSKPTAKDQAYVYTSTPAPAVAASLTSLNCWEIANGSL